MILAVIQFLINESLTNHFFFIKTLGSAYEMFGV